MATQTNEQRLAALREEYATLKALGLALDLTRGKPSSAQLDLSNAMLGSIDPSTASGNNSESTDLRNYGGLSGLAAAKTWFADMLDIDLEGSDSAIFVGGNSSLSLMQFSLWLANFFGMKAGDASWQEEANGAGVKMLCPVPGYDRHFSLCEHLGIEMIPVALTGHGPDMDQVEALVKSDPLIKGIWCVPRFSNPTGETYSPETVERIAKLASSAGKNFYVFWDNAYAVHALSDDATALEPIMSIAEANGTLDSILHFASTSKVSFAGAGMSALATSKANMAGFLKQFGFTSIGPDKLNQLRHLQMLPDRAALAEHMRKHAASITDKFQCVEKILTELLSGDSEAEYGEWTSPEGGYFISFDTQPGLASRVISLAAEAGVKLTPAGSTFPYRKDPNDSNIRLAPTFPALAEVEQAIRVFAVCVKLATVEKLTES